MPAPYRAGSPRQFRPSRYVRSTGTIDVRDQRTWVIALHPSGHPVGSWVEPGLRDTQIRPPETTTTTFSASGTSFAFTTPDIVAGVLLVAVFGYNTPSTTDVANTLPAGWTEAPPATGGQFDSGATLGSAHLVVATKTAAGGIENHTWTTASTVSSAVIAVLAYPGADTVDPWDQAAYSDETASTTTHATATITPAETSTWVVAAWMSRNNAQFTSDITVGTPDLTHRVLNLASNGGAEGTSGVRLLVADSDDAEVLTGAGISWTATEPSATSCVPDFVGTLRPASLAAAQNAPRGPTAASARTTPVAASAIILRSAANPPVSDDRRPAALIAAAATAPAATPHPWIAATDAPPSETPTEPTARTAATRQMPPAALPAILLRSAAEAVVIDDAPPSLLVVAHAAASTSPPPLLLARPAADELGADDPPRPAPIIAVGRPAAVAGRGWTTRGVTTDALPQHRTLIARTVPAASAVTAAWLRRPGVEDVVTDDTPPGPLTVHLPTLASRAMSPWLLGPRDVAAPQSPPGPLIAGLRPLPVPAGSPWLLAAHDVTPLPVERAAPVLLGRALWPVAAAIATVLRRSTAEPVAEVAPRPIAPRLPARATTAPPAAAILASAADVEAVRARTVLLVQASAAALTGPTGPTVARARAAEAPPVPPRPITLAVYAARIIAITTWQAHAAHDPVAAAATIGQITSGAHHGATITTADPLLGGITSSSDSPQPISSADPPLGGITTGPRHTSTITPGS